MVCRTMGSHLKVILEDDIVDFGVVLPTIDELRGDTRETPLIMGEVSAQPPRRDMMAN